MLRTHLGVDEAFSPTTSVLSSSRETGKQLHSHYKITSDFRNVGPIVTVLLGFEVFTFSADRGECFAPLIVLHDSYILAEY